MKDKYLASRQVPIAKLFQLIIIGKVIGDCDDHRNHHIMHAPAAFVHLCQHYARCFRTLIVLKVQRW